MKLVKFKVVFGLSESKMRNVVATSPYEASRKMNFPGFNDIAQIDDEERFGEECKVWTYNSYDSEYRKQVIKIYLPKSSCPDSFAKK